MASRREVPPEIKQRRRSRIMQFMIGLFVIWTIYRLIMQVIAHQEANERIAQLQIQLDQSKKSLAELQNEVKRLNDPEYIEQVAREQHNMIKPGERAIESLRK